MVGLCVFGISPECGDLGRSLDISQKDKAQIVTSRAVAPLNKLIAWSLPLVEKGGKVLAIKGEKAQEELEEAKRELVSLKGSTATIKTCGLALDLSVTVVEISKG